MSDEQYRNKWWVVRASPPPSDWDPYDWSSYPENTHHKRRRRFPTRERAKSYADYLRDRGYWDIMIGYLNPRGDCPIKRESRKPPRWLYDYMISNWISY